MSIRKFVFTSIALGVLGAGGYAAYRTQDRWVPSVFPSKPAAKSDGHGHSHDDGHDHAGHDHGSRSDRVTLSEQAQKNLGLDVDQLAPQEYWRTIMIPGIVVDRPGESDRGVTSRVAGVITAISARPGDTVKPGQPLFTLQLASEFLQGAQADLAKTAKEIEFAVTERERVANLVKQGTTPEAELIKQQNAVARLNTQLEASRRQLQVFGLTPAQVDQVQQGKVVTEMTVVAPAHRPQPVPMSSVPPPVEPLFEVQELKVSLGEQVTAGQTLALLSNHQWLFVEGHAFKSEADALAAAAEHKTPIRAEFSDEAAGAWPARGPLTVHHLSNMVDPAARTFAFYLPLDNQSRTFERDGKTFYVWRYRPGQRVRLRVPVEKLVTFASDGKSEVRPFVLSAGAVVREGAETYVFVQNGDVFIRKPVRVLYEDRRDAVLANDGSVTEADFVVKNQAAAINRALKAAVGGGGGHGHDHAGHSHDH